MADADALSDLVQHGQALLTRARDAGQQIESRQDALDDLVAVLDAISLEGHLLSLPERSARDPSAAEGAGRMRYLEHRLTTGTQRQRFHTARNRGGQCAACGRDIGADEAVYIERFSDGTTYRCGPVGIECASTESLQRTPGEEPEACEECGRGVYDGTSARQR